MKAEINKVGERKQGIKDRWKKLPGFFHWGIPVVFFIILVSGGYVIIRQVINSQSTATSQSTMQTAIARQGDLIIRASGTGTLISANELSIGFQTSGMLKSLNVNIGDNVTEGQVLAQLDTTSLEAELLQAKQNLAQLTSPAAIATAEQSLADAQTSLGTAKYSLSYYISSSVLYWREKVLSAQQALDLAKATAKNSPSAVNNQAEINANDNFINSKANLAGAEAEYWSTYVAEYFTTYCTDQTTKEKYKCVVPPADSVVAAAQAAYDLAKASVQEDQYLIAALTGGIVPDGATGTGLDTLNQAKLAVQTAQTNLDDATLKAPFTGTIMDVTAKAGEMVASGTIITIADLSKSDLQIYMDETDWQNVKVGYAIEATFDALPNQVFTGKVIQVYPALASISGSTMIEGLAGLDETPKSGNDPLPLGVSAGVDVIAAQAKNVVLVPVEALHELSAGNYAVFVVESGKPILRTVEVGLQDATFAEIKSGLKAGETVSTGIVETKQ